MKQKRWMQSAIRTAASGEVRLPWLRTTGGRSLIQQRLVEMPQPKARVAQA